MINGSCQVSQFWGLLQICLNVLLTPVTGGLSAIAFHSLTWVVSEIAVVF